MTRTYSRPPEAPEQPRDHAAAAPALSAPALSVPAGLWSRPILPGLGVALLVFFTLLPTLNWLEFYNSIEHLVVATSLETRRDGHWLMPTLLGEVRTRKPPTAAWLTALSISSETMAGLSDPDPTVRAAAYQRLGTEARLPPLIASCLMLVAVYELGRVIADARVGLCAAAIAGSTYLFLQYSRLATPDTHLMLWATAASAFLALAVLKGRLWLGCLGGGVCLGLGFMSKGPVALLLSVAPVLAYLAWGRWGPTPRARETHSDDAPATSSGLSPLPRVLAGERVRVRGRGQEGEGTTNDDGGQENHPAVRDSSFTLPPSSVPRDGPSPPPSPPRTGEREWTSGDAAHRSDSPVAPAPFRAWVGPILGGLALMLAIALPWYALVIARVPNVWEVWFNEVTRIDPVEPRPDPWYDAFQILLVFLPWTLWLVPALFKSVTTLRRQRRHPALLAFWMLVIPWLVFNLISERKSRYLQPVIGPAAVLAAWVLVEHLWRRGPATASQKFLVRAHWVVIGLVMFGLPIWGIGYRAEGGESWFSPTIAVTCLALSAVILVTGLLAFRRGRPSAAVTVALVGMLMADALFRAGYRNTAGGRSDLKPLADAVAAAVPHGPAYSLNPNGRHAPLDLTLYLNRIVTPVDSVAEIPPAPQPQVLILAQPGPRDAAPTPPPPPSDEWRPLATGRRGRTGWHAFVRQPTAGAAAGAAAGANQPLP